MGAFLGSWAMRAIFFALCGLIFGCISITDAQSETITINYTGVVDNISIVGVPHQSYDYLLGPFTLTTTVNTSVGTLVPAVGGFTFSAGLAPLVYPVVPPSVPDYAFGSFGFWGYYGVQMTLSGSTVSQKFYSAQGGPGYFDVVTPYLEIDPVGIGGTGGGTFFLDPGYPSGIGIYGYFTLNSAVSDQIAAIPEPSTWTMLLIGFAGIGFAAHRRRWAF